MTESIPAAEATAKRTEWDSARTAAPEGTLLTRSGCDVRPRTVSQQDRSTALKVTPLTPPLLILPVHIQAQLFKNVVPRLRVDGRHMTFQCSGECLRLERVHDEDAPLLVIALGAGHGGERRD